MSSHTRKIIIYFLLASSFLLIKSERTADHPIRHHHVNRRKTHLSLKQTFLRELDDKLSSISTAPLQQDPWLQSSSSHYEVIDNLAPLPTTSSNSSYFSDLRTEKLWPLHSNEELENGVMKNEENHFFRKKRKRTDSEEKNVKTQEDSVAELPSSRIHGISPLGVEGVASGPISDNSGVMIKFSGRRLIESTHEGSNIAISSSGGAQKRKYFYPSTIPRSNETNLWGLSYSPGTIEAGLNNTNINITIQAGITAFLPCRVGHLGDTQISWIRRRDWRVLTSGDQLYTHDKRFSVLHETSSHDWTLHIKWVSDRDEGAYECQVSTGTGIISLFVNLRVIVPEATIAGQEQFHVYRRSSISLTCTIHKVLIPPQHVLWHHNKELLNFLRGRPEVSIVTEKPVLRYTLIDTIGRNYTYENKILDIRSHLKISSAKDFHSGNYSCSIPNAIPATIRVFITEGDKIAAVQRIDSGSQQVISMQIWVLQVTLQILYFTKSFS